jgi:hypothetical protein
VRGVAAWPDYQQFAAPTWAILSSKLRFLVLFVVRVRGPLSVSMVPVSTARQARHVEMPVHRLLLPIHHITSHHADDDGPSSYPI